jgi:hypothetical protein
MTLDPRRCLTMPRRQPLAPLLLVALALALPAHADVEIRQGGSSWAVLEDDGTVRIGGSAIGRVEEDGTVRLHGSSIGRIESSGSIYRGGSSWGSASNCCGDFGSKRSVAAVLAFFSDFFER